MTLQKMIIYAIVVGIILGILTYLARKFYGYDIKVYSLAIQVGLVVFLLLKNKKAKQS
ncbi:hypothetical protein ACQ33O_00470 [Ferruginibacter sp. SUN002]|uniref:hypothetical protein n=1 Tax=Ferruginibacter sp. SUN002 TaxID=2937789 RepID=UPI003D36A63A